MIGAYIIFSKKINRFYIGSTTDFKQKKSTHNKHLLRDYLRYF
ncbi:MAG TPA: hypothetical protein EYG86_02505 [Crocinitomicaceae bacterium]|nr:hypothetical protein [Crocinitomicaceae bacterium]